MFYFCFKQFTPHTQKIMNETDENKFCTYCNLEFNSCHFDKKGECKVRKSDRFKEWRLLNRDRLNKKMKDWHAQNKEKDLTWNAANKDKKSASSKKWKTKNKDKISVYNKSYRKENKTKINKLKTKYYHQKKTDPIFKITINLKNKISKAVRGRCSKSFHLNYLGCTAEELKIYLENQFQSGMTWDNYGPKGWHIDHIRPMCSFDLSNHEELKEACHYTNLQPLWAIDNLKKGKKWNPKK